MQQQPSVKWSVVDTLIFCLFIMSKNKKPSNDKNRPKASIKINTDKPKKTMKQFSNNSNSGKSIIKLTTDKPKNFPEENSTEK